MLCRSSAAAMSDRTTALTALLAEVGNNKGAGWLRKALATDADLDIVYQAAGNPAKPQLTATVAAAPDPHKDTTFAGVVGIQGLLQIAKDKSAITAQRLAAIAELQNNLSLISPSEFPNLNTAAAGAGRGYDNSEISAQLTLLQNLIQSGQG